MSVIEPWPWWPLIGMPLIAEMSIDDPLAPAESTPPWPVAPSPHARPDTVGSRPEADEELDHAEDPAVDQAGLDVAAAARVDVDVRIGQHPVGQLLLGHQQDLAD